MNNSELVAVPTETVYGIACNGLDINAVEKVYDIKGRPQIKPLSLMVHDVTWIDRLCDDVPSAAYLLADKYWPGPLTIILKSKDFIPSIVRAGGSTVGLRCPDNDLTLKLIEMSNLPLAAPSANPSGKPSAKSAEDVYAYFGDKVNILDGGVCSIGVESSIVDLSKTPYSVLRVGAIPKNEIVNSIVENLNVIGLTGQSGSGKSLALSFISDYEGIGIIDCDKVYHELLDKNYEMLEELKIAFPDCFIDDKLDRKLLASVVFNNETLLNTLNLITHKYVLNEAQNRIVNFALNGKSACVIEAIELFSSNISSLCNKTVGIVSDDINKISRLMLRDGLTEEKAYERLKAQKPVNYYIDNCDITVFNNGTEEEFIDDIRKVFDLNG